jgi:hypothetical protein
LAFWQFTQSVGVEPKDSQVRKGLPPITLLRGVFLSSDRECPRTQA